MIHFGDEEECLTWHGNPHDTEIHGHFCKQVVPWTCLQDTEDVSKGGSCNGSNDGNKGKYIGGIGVFEVLVSHSGSLENSKHNSHAENSCVSIRNGQPNIDVCAQANFYDYNLIHSAGNWEINDDQRIYGWPERKNLKMKVEGQNHALIH